MRCIVLVTKVKAISPVPTCLSISNVRTHVDALSSKIHFLLLVQVIRVLVCSFVLISKVWLLMRLKVPSITASPFFSASRTRLYKSMFFTLILSPSITTLRGTPFAALCITCFHQPNSTSLVSNQRTP